MTLKAVHQKAAQRPVTIAATGMIAMIGAALFAGPMSELSASAQALINGPLIEGPLIDLGSILSDIQLGQFQ